MSSSSSDAEETGLLKRAQIGSSNLVRFQYLRNVEDDQRLGFDPPPSSPSSTVTVRKKANVPPALAPQS